MEYAIVRHKPSGDRYAVAFGHNAAIMGAYGPLHGDEGSTTDDLEDIISNQATDYLEETASWLETQEWERED
jgi:hypothetical protein